MMCSDISKPIFLIFSDSVPSLLYYSHLPTLLISLIIGIFILFSSTEKRKSIPLFSLIIIFSIWVFSNLILWTNVEVSTILFTWSLFGIINSLIYIFSFLSAYTFFYSKNPSPKILISIFITFIPVVFYINDSIKYFDLRDCSAVENLNYFNYVFFGQVIYFFIVLVMGITAIKKTNSVLEKNKILYYLAGIIFFLVSFFTTGYIASLLDNFELEQYGLFGMTIFMVFLAYLIVKFKAFDIKLLVTQALVWGLIILIGSQFLFIRSTINKVLTAVTLVGAGMTGLLIVRSVKQVDQQREQLALANQEQEALLHFITHQVKGFFTKSRNIFSTLKDGDAGKIPDSIMKYVDEGLTSDESGIDMVQNILNASSLRSGKLQFNKKPFDVSDVVSKLAGKIGELAEIKGLKLNYTPPTEKIMINGDSLHIENAFRNLFENAVNYTQSGEITIDLSHATETVVLNVKDSGLGLTEADKAKLFTKGGRGEDARKINVNSTGYGLFIVKQIIGEHNGFIEARSEGRGKGSTFTVKLPLYVAPAVQATS